MKKAKIFTAMILTALVMLILSSCGGEETIVGVWEPTDGKGFSHLEFYDNGTASSSEGVGQYTVEGNKLRIMNMALAGTVLRWEYEVSGDSLTITWEDNGNVWEYERVKD